MITSVGVDEAGRGPVLGSMFAAAVGVPDAELLPDGLDDSKRLTPSRRESFATELREHSRVSIGVAEIPPARIDAPESDMNTLAVEAQARAIEQVVPDESVPGVLVDACDTDESRFERRVTEAVTPAVDLTAEHRADERHPIVAAASVVAKVERDAHVGKLAEEFGDVGSGYPNDPATTEFLEAYVDEHGELPPCARSSWSTCERLLAEHEQQGLGEF